MGLSAFNAMRARLKREQAEAEKTSSLKVEEVKEPEITVESKPEKEGSKKKTDAEKLKGKKD